MAQRSIPRTPVPGWDRRFPWLLAGTTKRHSGTQEPNFGLFTRLPAQGVMDAWSRLLDDLGSGAAVHSHQVHGPDVHVHERSEPGFRLAPPADGHVTQIEGLLLTVTTADCVPVFIVDPEKRSIGLLHAGWRGTAAGVLGAGITRLVDDLGSAASSLHVHLGPAICGRCYEVGAEVFEALGLPGGTALDLRGFLVSRCVELGVPSHQISSSDACTKCSNGAFFSHRAGDAGRQIAYLALKPAEVVAQ